MGCVGRGGRGRGGRGGGGGGWWCVFFNDTATTEIYTLSLHDALPISEAELIDTYLPAGLEDEQLKAIIREAISETGAAGMADMGRVMKVAMERVAARADGKVVSEMAREALSG